MLTPSHFLITAALRKAFSRIPIGKSAVYLGSVAPDVPILLLSIGGYIYFHYLLGWEGREAFKYIYGVLFFQDPFWIFFHNILQAPLVLIAGLVTLWKFYGKENALTNWWFWFFAACLLHAFVDILTHNNDGPLLFFPVDWGYRFASPFSYWDRNYYGEIFSQFERILDAGLVVYLAGPPLWHRGTRLYRRLLGKHHVPSRDDTSVHSKT